MYELILEALYLYLLLGLGWAIIRVSLVAYCFATMKPYKTSNSKEREVVQSILNRLKEKLSLYPMPIAITIVVVVVTALSINIVVFWPRYMKKYIRNRLSWRSDK